MALDTMKEMIPMEELLATRKDTSMHGLENSAEHMNGLMEQAVDQNIADKKHTRDKIIAFNKEFGRDQDDEPQEEFGVVYSIKTGFKQKVRTPGETLRQFHLEDHPDCNQNLAIFCYSVNT